MYADQLASDSHINLVPWLSNVRNGGSDGSAAPVIEAYRRPTVTWWSSMYDSLFSSDNLPVTIAFLVIGTTMFAGAMGAGAVGVVWTVFALSIFGGVLHVIAAYFFDSP